MMMTNMAQTIVNALDERLEQIVGNVRAKIRQQHRQQQQQQQQQQPEQQQQQQHVLHIQRVVDTKTEGRTDGLTG
ncbi:hypothetical protein M5D96_006504 [Drosophila gunungcola]|uniref:Uncharacterized protein n=1 Tax=Drosophila gunungcola TaxID=103775 RepID=A0A9P9YP92_9MUSC|nr:hypothetical protein M5D96_006504 [Drosophila gunungcola]